MVRIVLLQLIGFESNAILPAVCIISNNSAGITSTLHTFHIPRDTHKQTHVQKCTDTHNYPFIRLFIP
jgi:hypothetical protein